MSRLGAHVAEYLHELRVRRGSRVQIELAELVLTRLLAHLAQCRLTDACAVEERHVSAFSRALASRTTRQGRPIAFTTWAQYMGYVRRFFGFLHRRGAILSDPTRFLVLPRVRHLPRGILTVREAERVIGETFSGTPVGSRDRAILELLYGTGLRRGECLRLDLSDVDLEAARLLVRDGKGRRDRIVPLPGRAAKALDSYLREARGELLGGGRGSALFLTRDGARLSRTQLNDRVRRYGRLAGLRSALSPHGLRHTCATHLLQGGADVRHVQELLGHQSLETTQLYTRVALQDLRELLARAHPRETPMRRRRSRHGPF